MPEKFDESLIANGAMTPLVEITSHDFTLRAGEARVAVLVDDSMFVLASDSRPSDLAITSRKKALMLALLNIAIEEVHAMKVGE